MGDGEVRRPPGRVSNVHNKQTLLSSVSRHKTYELHSPRFIHHTYTSPASPWLISDFNLFGRPLREGSLLFIYIVRFIYRDGETRSWRSGGAYLHTCQRGQGHYEAQLAACPHNCSFLASDCRSHTFWVFKYFAHNQQSTMVELKIKIVRSTARYSWWQH